MGERACVFGRAKWADSLRHPGSAPSKVSSAGAPPARHPPVLTKTGPAARQRGTDKAVPEGFSSAEHEAVNSDGLPGITLCVPLTPKQHVAGDNSQGTFSNSAGHLPVRRYCCPTPRLSTSGGRSTFVLIPPARVLGKLLLLLLLTPSPSPSSHQTLPAHHIIGKHQTARLSLPVSNFITGKPLCRTGAGSAPQAAN